jgi:hypothetical protein
MLTTRQCDRPVAERIAEAADYVRCRTATFGGINFVGEGFGVKILRPWDPSTNLDLSGLN